MTRGYLTLATGRPEYYTWANNLARSILKYEATAQICLLHDADEQIARQHAPSFTHYVQVDQDQVPRGVEIKLHVDKYTPFSRTMYLDADMLMSNPGADEIWEHAGGSDVLFAGAKLSKGVWYTDIAEVIKANNLDHVVKHNSGSFYFTSGARSREFFSFCREIRESRPFISSEHSHGRGISDEPIFGVALAHFSIEPYTDLSNWHVSTLRLEDWRVEGERTSIQRGGKWHSPKFVHFIGLGKAHGAKDLYRSLVGLLDGDRKVEAGSANAT